MTTISVDLDEWNQMKQRLDRVEKRLDAAAPALALNAVETMRTDSLRMFQTTWDRQDKRFDAVDKRFDHIDRKLGEILDRLP